MTESIKTEYYLAGTSSSPKISSTFTLGAFDAKTSFARLGSGFKAKLVNPEDFGSPIIYISFFTRMREVSSSSSIFFWIIAADTHKFRMKRTNCLLLLLFLFLLDNKPQT